jgi:hypothetical protein
MAKARGKGAQGRHALSQAQALMRLFEFGSLVLGLRGSRVGIADCLDLLLSALKLAGEPLIQLSNVIEGFCDAARNASPGLWEADGKVPAPQRDERIKQAGCIQDFVRWRIHDDSRHRCISLF